MPTITPNEAVARLSGASWISARFEPIGHGRHETLRLRRTEVVNWLRGSEIHEGGPTAQKCNYGMFVNFKSLSQGQGRLFLPTKPECRLNLEQLVNGRATGCTQFNARVTLERMRRDQRRKVRR
jgi:hypothetical protein